MLMKKKKQTKQKKIKKRPKFYSSQSLSLSRSSDLNNFLLATTYYY